MIEKSCKECNRPFQETERINKVFCNIKCKNTFHNKIQKHKRHIRRKFDKLLYKNHDLLIEYRNQKQVPLKELTLKGFNKSYCNRVHCDIHNVQWKICYDFAFREVIINEEFFILMIQNKINPHNYDYKN